MSARREFPIVKTVMWNVIVAVFMVAAAAADLLFRFADLDASPFWAPTGLALAVVLLSRYRMLAGLFVGNLTANVFWFLDQLQNPLQAFLGATGVAVTSMLSIVLAYHLLVTRMSLRNPFGGSRPFGVFVAVAFLVSIFSAGMGTVVAQTVGALGNIQWPIMFATWLLGDVLGMLIVTPLIVLLANRFSPHNSARAWAERFVILAALTVLTYLIFFDPQNSTVLSARPFWILPLILWIGLRFERSAMAIAVLSVSVIALLGTASGGGPFVAGSTASAFLGIQCFLGITAVAGMLLSVTVFERDVTLHEARVLSAELERRVRERTAKLRRQVQEHRQALLAREESEQRFRFFVSASSEALWHVEFDAPVPIDLPIDEQIERYIDSAYFVDGNDAVTRLLGLESRDDLINARLADVIDRTDPRRIYEIRTFIESGYRMVNVELEVDLPDSGKEHWLMSRIGFVKDGKLYRSWGSARDVTDLRKAVHALMESEHKYMVAFRESPDSITISTLGNGVMVDVNEGFERIMGIARDDAIGRSSLDLGIWANPGQRAAIVAELERSGRVSNVEVEMKHTSGEIRTCLISADVVKMGAAPHVLALIRDVTDMKRAEEALQKSEEKYSVAFHAAPDSVTITSVADGRLVDVNDGFTSTTGFSREEAIGKTGVDLKIWPDAGRRDEMLRVLKKNGVVSNFESEFYMRDGAKRIGSVNAHPIEVNGEACILTVTKDVTEQYRAAEERRRLEHQVRQLQKLEAIGTLAGGIAHDFNNILGASLGFTELAIARLDSDDPVQGYLGEILAAGNRARDLVRQILAFSRKDPGDYGPVHIDEVASEAVSLIRATIPASIDIQKKFNGGDTRIDGDSSQIHQLLINLLANAAQALPDGGRITVSVDRREFCEPVETVAGTLDPGHYAELVVEDDGVGIHGDIIGRILDPFFTTKEVGQGTGLGLSVVHGIVREHRGGLRISSAPGQGSRFEILLPEVAATAEESAAREADLPMGNGETVLLIDDEEALITIGREILRDLGYKPTTCSLGGEALELIQQSQADFDVVITDLSMPDMSGVDLARRIHDAQPDTPVILTTGTSPASVDGNLDDIHEVLMKPLTRRVLGLCVAEALRSRHESAPASREARR